MAVRSNLKAASTNLVPNPSVEQVTTSKSGDKPTSWATLTNGTNTTAFNYLKTGHSGNRSLQVNMTKRTSGDAEWYFTPVAVKANTKYTYSDWYQSTFTSQTAVVVTNTSGQDSIIASPMQAASSAWKQVNYTFTTPANAKSVTVRHFINKVGKLTTDDFSLTEATVPTAPTVTMTSPANGATVSGTTNTVSANASDTVGVAGVQFKLDGVNLGAEDTTAPYAVNFDSTTVSDGSHTLSAVARNTSGLTSTATNVTVNVNNTIVTPPSDNLVNNPSADTSSNGTSPDGWTTSSWGTNTPSYTYLNTGHGGGHSLKTEITNYTSGDAKWVFNDVNVAPNKSYTFSDYFQSNIGSQFVAQYTDTSGNVTYQWLADIPASSAWTYKGVTFTTPANVQKVTILHFIAGNGWLIIDDSQLVVTPTLQITNNVPNADLEQAEPTNPGLPMGWTASSWGTNTPKFEYLNDGHNGGHAVKTTVSNYTDGDAKWYFNPITNLVPGNQYKFSTWYKTNSIPHAVAMYNMSDGTTKFYGMSNPQPNGTSDWQFYSNSFQVPLGTQSVSVFFFMPNNGWVEVDDQAIVPYTPVGWNRPLVTLTFDDGEEDNVTNALPLLNQYGFKTTQCFETESIEGVQGGPENVMAFFNSGHEICSHTVTHPMLTQVPLTQLTYELTHPQTYLQSLTGKPVRDFASPYGDYNQAVNTEIMKYYRSHRTVDEGYNSKDNFDIYRLRVQNMTPTTTLEQYNYWINQAIKDNTWLILVYHRIATDTPDAYDTMLPDFKLQMQALKNSGVTVKTWSDALDEVTAQL